MKYTALLATATLVAASAAPLAHAASASAASLSFNVLATSGFTWLTTPVSSATSDAASYELLGFELSAGVFSPTYGPAVVDSDLAIGSAVPSSSAAATAGTVFSQASGFGNAAGTSATLSASALAPEGGKAEATSFARSWFSLAAGSSVTFQGALLLSMTGSLPMQPANYSTGDFYGFASGLLAVGSIESQRQLGGPLTTGMTGSYSLNDLGLLSVTVNNTTSTLLTTYLDSGVTVYSASVVPEPGTWALLLAGVAAVVVTARRPSTRA